MYKPDAQGGMGPNFSSLRSNSPSQCQRCVFALTQAAVIGFEGASESESYVFGGRGRLEKKFSVRSLVGPFFCSSVSGPQALERRHWRFSLASSEQLYVSLSSYMRSIGCLQYSYPLDVVWSQYVDNALVLSALHRFASPLPSVVFSLRVFTQ